MNEIESIERDIRKLIQAISIMEKIKQHLKQGEPMAEIEESMAEDFDELDTLVGEVYLGE